MLIRNHWSAPPLLPPPQNTLEEFDVSAEDQRLFVEKFAALKEGDDSGASGGGGDAVDLSTVFVDWVALRAGASGGDNAAMFKTSTLMLSVAPNDSAASRTASAAAWGPRFDVCADTIAATLSSLMTSHTPSVARMSSLSLSSSSRVDTSGVGMRPQRMSRGTKVLGREIPMRAFTPG